MSIALPPVRPVALLHDRTMIVEGKKMSGLTPRGLWAYWYETAETVIVKVIDAHNCWWVRPGDVLLVPPHSVEPLDLLDQTIFVCHESNAIVRVQGSGR